MNLKEYVGRAKQIGPGLDKLHEGRGVMLLREVFQQIAWQIKGMTEGVVVVPFFGRFIVKQVEREKDGQKSLVKRVIFRIADKDAPNKA